MQTMTPSAPISQVPQQQALQVIAMPGDRGDIQLFYLNAATGQHEPLPAHLVGPAMQQFVQQQQQQQSMKR
jgi:hypothetical protein